MKILQKIKNSFINATKGQESFKVVCWLWGAIFYFLALFVFDNLIRKIDYKFFDKSLSIFCVIYAVWHLFVTIRCAPKKTKLTLEEKKIEEVKAANIGGGALNSFARKLFLQEPIITKKNPRNILILIDLFMILHFFSLK